jgi:DNA-binding NarL/FixJ family response regulator
MILYPEIERPIVHRLAVLYRLYKEHLYNEGTIRALINNRRKESIKIKASFIERAYKLGYTQEEIAEVMDINHSTVSHHLNKR